MNLKFLVERRKKLELSQQELASLLGFANASVYCKYEKGEYKFKADMLPALAKALRCKVKDFF